MPKAPYDSSVKDKPLRPAAEGEIRNYMMILRPSSDTYLVLVIKQFIRSRLPIFLRVLFEPPEHICLSSNSWQRL